MRISLALRRYVARRIWHSFRDINDAKVYPLALAKAPSEELYIK
jgi:hypothetical protein